MHSVHTKTYSSLPPAQERRSEWANVQREACEQSQWCREQAKGNEWAPSSVSRRANGSICFNSVWFLPIVHECRLSRTLLNEKLQKKNNGNASKSDAFYWLLFHHSKSQRKRSRPWIAGIEWSELNWGSTNTMVRGFRSTCIRDVKYWATRLLICSIARTAHWFACSELLAMLALSARLLRLLARSLTHFWARGTVWFLMYHVHAALKDSAMVAFLNPSFNSFKSTAFTNCIVLCMLLLNCDNNTILQVLCISGVS